jgi:alanine racemase
MSAQRNSHGPLEAEAFRRTRPSACDERLETLSWEAIAMRDNLSLTAVLDINLEAVQANYRFMRTLIAPHVVAAAVVKSDAYGLGLVPVAHALQDAGCNTFFVADLDEAILLRSELPHVAIAVLRADLDANEGIFGEKRLIPVVNSLEDLGTIRRMPELVPFLLNIDTGLTRLGLTQEDVKWLSWADGLQGLPLVGLMSHLACSDQRDDPANEIQRERFMTACNLLRPRSASFSATAGVWLGSAYHFDMVRLGSALYGLNKARVEPNPLHPVIRLSARVVDIRDVPAREIVGYGGTFRTSRRSRIAVAGVGYKHGLPIACSNKISAHIGGFAAPVIGRVSMEYVMLDATDVPEAVLHTGAWVEILNDAVGPDDVARGAMFTPQELVARLGSCCSKRYAAPALAPEQPQDRPVAVSMLGQAALQ